MKTPRPAPVKNGDFPTPNSFVPVPLSTACYHGLRRDARSYSPVATAARSVGRRNFLRVAGAGLALPGVAMLAQPVAAQLLPDAEGTAMVRALKDNMPQEHIWVPATLSGKNEEGRRVFVKAEIELNYGAARPFALYTILDPANPARILKRIRISWVPGQPPVLEEWRGAGLAYMANNPGLLHQRIQDLDITWADLSLSFLFWQGGRVLDKHVKKTRLCHKVQVMAPAWEKHLFAGVHLWIDDKARMVMEAMSFDPQGNPKRQFEVNAVAKFTHEGQDRWIAKELQFFSLMMPKGRKFPRKTSSVKVMLDPARLRVMK